MPARRSLAGGAKKRPTRYREDDDPNLREATRLHRRGAYAEAIARYEAVIAEDASSLDAWMNLGAAALSLGRVAEAKRAFESALVLPPDARAARDIGIGLTALGYGERAREAFERALRIDPMLIGARLCLARLLLESGDREAAIEHARRAVADAPDQAATHLELHIALFDGENIQPAIPPALEALARDPGYALGQYFAAGALMLADRTEEAQALRSGRLFGPGLDAALVYALSKRHPSLRYFSTRRATLLHALDAARPTGSVLELGVRFGVSTRIIADATDERLHAFDSFEGLPEAWNGKPRGAFSTGGEIPELPAHVEVHVGLFEHTLQSVTANLEEPRFIHIDSDLYSSAHTALTVLMPRVSRGAVIVFDEYLGNERWQEDEFRAFEEASVSHGFSYEYLSMSWITGQAAVRIL